MKRFDWNRRQTLGVGLALATTPAWGADAGLKFTMPDGACDAHHHIYDPRFPYVSSASSVASAPNGRDASDRRRGGGRGAGGGGGGERVATVADYYAFRKAFGTSRDVIILPSVYAVDNDPLYFFEGQMGENTRSIGVLRADVSDGELRDLTAVGVRGVRIQFLGAEGSGLFKREDILPIAKRIAPLGWHIQFHMPGPLLTELEPLILSLPTPIVVDHMAHASSVDQPQYKTMRKILDTGRGWIKVSGMEMDSKVGAPLYSDTAAVAAAYIRANPDRVVWGSNWPVTRANMIDLLNVLATVAGSSEQLQRILVENPEALYGFDPTKRPRAIL